MADEYKSAYSGSEMDSVFGKVQANSGSWDDIITYTASLDIVLNSRSIIYNDDLMPTGDNNNYSGTIIKKLAGENLYFGNICYMTSSGELMKANASSSEKCQDYIWQ